MPSALIQILGGFRKCASGMALALTLSTTANAAGWTGDLTVTSAFTEATTDLIVIYTSGGTGYTAGCIPNTWIFTASTSARGVRGYATVLLAIASGKKVRFWYSDTCATWSYHEATTVMVVN